MDGIKGVDYVYLEETASREEYIKLLNYLKPTIIAIVWIDAKKTRDYSSPYRELKEFSDKPGPAYSTTEIIERVVKNEA